MILYDNYDLKLKMYEFVGIDIYYLMSISASRFTEVNTCIVFMCLALTSNCNL